jgi:hypothetical protein
MPQKAPKELKKSPQNKKRQHNALDDKDRDQG